MSGTSKIRTKDEILQIRELSKQTISPWLFHMILDWSIIGLALLFAQKLHSIPAYLAALLIIGNRQHALAVLGHEGTHYTLHMNRKFNDFLSNLFCFWPLLLTVNGYRRLHFTHHSNTGTISDPELLHKQARAPQWDLPLDKKKVLLYAVKDVFGYSIQDLFIILTFSRPENKKMLLPAAFLHLGFIIISIVTGCWEAVPLWYGALATTFMMFFRFRLWFEHQGTSDTQRIHLTPIYAAIFAPHKIWLHWEHHRCPTVPYHKLEDARAILKGPAPISLSELINKLHSSDFIPSGGIIADADAAE